MMSLQEFYNDHETRDNVKEYLALFFKEEAVRKLMKREDAVALADATEMLDKAFSNLEDMFEPKPKRKNKINQSR